MPKLSIVVPIYNVSKYLSRCLDSLLGQTNDDYELILINDCSTDSSLEIAERYARKMPNKISLISNTKNEGLGYTRNLGLFMSKGEYITFVDSDDYVAKDYVQRYLDAANQHDVDVIIGGYTRDIDGKLRKHFVSNSIWSLTTYTIACAKMYRTDFLRNNNVHFSNIRCGEDIYFSSVLFCSNPSFYVMHYAGYHYYFNRKSITGTLNFKKNHEVFVSNLFNEITDTCPLSTLTSDQKWVIQYSYLANMINALLVHNRGCGKALMKKKYKFVFEDAKKKFPDYEQNPYISLIKPKGQTIKIRVSVWLLVKLRQIRMDHFIYEMAARS